MTSFAGRVVRVLALAVGTAGAADFVPPTQDGVGIQAAIDAAAAAGGGRVVLEKAVYPSGSLRLRSKVELNIPEGALIRGHDCPGLYDDVDDPRIGKAPENSKKVFLWCFDGEDIAITGGGVIDGQGPKFYDPNVPLGRTFYLKPPHPRPRMVELYRCKRVRFEGVTFKDSPGWTFWIRNCEDVAAERIRVVGDQRMINNDGLHFDGCRRMRVRNCLLRTGDDSVVFRAIQAPDRNPEDEVGEDLLVEGCVLDSACQCVRIGCPDDVLLRHAVFTNCTFRGRNAIASIHPYRYLRFGDRGETGRCRMEDILVVDCDVDVSGSPVVLTVDPGVTLRGFGNVTFRNVRMRGGRPITLLGTGDSPVENVRFENVSGEIAADTPIRTRATKGLSFDGFRISSAPGAKSAIVLSPGRTEFMLVSDDPAVRAAADELKGLLEASVLGDVRFVERPSPRAATVVIGGPPRRGSFFNVRTDGGKLFLDCTAESARSAVHALAVRFLPPRFPDDGRIGDVPLHECLRLPDGLDLDERSSYSDVF